MTGCFNRPAFRAVLPVQDGWFLDSDTRTPRMVPWVIRAEPDCQYTLSDLGRVDLGCTGCTWKARAVQPIANCPCRLCIRAEDKDKPWNEQREITRMIVCPICGCKRCPHANAHENACTDSNEPGQPGSAY